MALLVSKYAEISKESKTCFAKKENGQNRRFNLEKRAVSGRVRKGPEWIRNVFMRFDEGLDDF